MIMRVSLLLPVLSLIFKLVVASEPIPIKPEDPAVAEPKTRNPTEVASEYSSVAESLTKTSTKSTKTSTSKASSSKTTSATTISCSANDTACLSCGQAFATVFDCSSIIPYFLDLPDYLEAPCLCYNPANAYNDNASDFSLVWVPNEFDGPYSYCPQWFATVDPADTSDLAVLSSVLGFCNSEGNILGVKSMVATSAIPTATGNSTTSVILTAAPSAGQTATGSQPGQTSTSEAVGSVKVRLMTVVSLLLVSTSIFL